MNLIPQVPVVDRGAVVRAERHRTAVQVTVGERIFSSDHVRPLKVARISVEAARALRDELTAAIEEVGG